MERVYLENGDITVTLRDDLLLDVILFGKDKYEAVEARRLFPVSCRNDYISLLENSGDEIAIIRKLDSFDNSVKLPILKSLEEYYMIPVIKKIINTHVKTFGIVEVNAETDHGICFFEIHDRVHNIKCLHDGRILIKDTNDNRYQIISRSVLDRRTLDAFLI